jgi:hypothetical protein
MLFYSKDTVTADTRLLHMRLQGPFALARATCATQQLRLLPLIEHILYCDCTIGLVESATSM